MDIKEVLEKLPPAPAGIEKCIRGNWIRNRYLIYSKKENKVVCTGCGHTYKADRYVISHDAKGECPRCKAQATYKASGIKRGKLKETLRVLVFTRRGQAVYATLTNVVIDFSPFGKPEIKTNLSAVYVFSKKESCYWVNKYGYFGGEWWERRKKIKLPAEPNYYSSNAYWPTYMYTGNLESVFTKSCLKYLWIPEFIRGNNINSEQMIRYIDEGLKNQSLELLIKAGFTNIALHRIKENQGMGNVNWRGKDLQKILRLPKRHVRFLRRYNPEYLHLRIFQALTEKEKLEASWEDIRYIGTFSMWKFDELRALVPILKWSRYVSELERRPTMTDYLDYIENCRNIGEDINRKEVMFPRDFWEAHDTAAEKVKIEKDKAREEKIRNNTFDLHIENEGLVCYMARTQTELNTESRILNHCVRTYGDKLARGDCYIFFIRKSTDEDKPYYTLEVNKMGEFIQCRGDHNCSMTEEVKMFVEQFVKDFKKILKTKNAERSAA